MRIAVFLSGKGSNLLSILDAIEAGKLNATVSLIVSNRPDAGGLEVGRSRGIPGVVFDRASYEDGERFGADMLQRLDEEKIDIIVLAGYLRKIPPTVLRAFRKRVVNIHPALLPKFGGKGMYGHFVHEAVIAAGESESGATVHYVDEIYDHGEIIARRACPVLPGDSPEDLAARVLIIEHQLYPEVLQSLSEELPPR